MEIKFRKRHINFYDIVCLDSVECPVRWKAFYVIAHNFQPPETYLREYKTPFQERSTPIAGTKNT